MDYYVHQGHIKVLKHTHKYTYMYLCKQIRMHYVNIDYKKRTNFC